MTSTGATIRAVTFDFYETLVYHRTGQGRGAALMEYLQDQALESEPWEHQVLYDIFEHHAVDYSPDLPEASRRRYFHRLAKRLFLRLKVQAPAGAERHHADRLWELLGPESLAVFPEVTEVLSRLKTAGYPTAVISNWQHGLGNFCRELGLDQFFDFIVVSAEVSSEKPDGEIFRNACRDLGSPPETVLHVGDSRVDDLQGARGAGLQAVLVRRGPSPEDHEVPAISDLTELIGIVSIPRQSRGL